MSTSSAPTERPRAIPRTTFAFLALLVLVGSSIFAGAVPVSGSPAATVAPPGTVRAVSAVPETPATIPAAITPHSSLIGNWTEGTDYGAATGDSGAGGLPIDNNACVSNETYVYCIGGRNFQTGAFYSAVYWANISAGGVVGPWNETIDYGAASGSTGDGGLAAMQTSCVEWNAYVYCVGGETSTGATSEVYYAQLISSGVGPWTETTDYGAASGTTGAGGIKADEPDCAATNGYIYCVTGNSGSSSTYYAQLSPTGVGPWTETTDYGAASGDTGAGGVDITYESCAANGSYIYCVGGEVTKPTFAVISAVYYAYVSPFGIGAWNETIDYGAWSGDTGAGGNDVFATACFTGNYHIFCVDGNGANFVNYENISYAATTSTGVGPWSNNEMYFLQDLAPAHRPAHVGPFASYFIACVLNKLWEYGFCTGGGVSYSETAPVATHIAHPTLTTTVSAALITPPMSVFDTAQLGGATADASGTVTYTAYDNDACAGTEVDSDVVTVVDATVPNSLAFSPATYAASTWSFLAVYSGDDDNVGVTALCEQFKVAPASPTLSTTVVSATVTAPDPETDSALLKGETTNAGGTVTYTMYLGTLCIGPTEATSTVDVTNGAVPLSADLTPPTWGVSYSILATYSGDANNNPATATCEPFATQLVVPTITTTLSSSSLTPSQTAYDTSSLQGATPNAGGTVTYKVYNGTACSGGVLWAYTATVTKGVLPNSGTFTPPSYSGPGYSFQAVYSGDAENTAATSSCEVLKTSTSASSGNSSSSGALGLSSNELLAVSILILLVAVILVVLLAVASKRRKRAIQGKGGSTTETAASGASGSGATPGETTSESGAPTVVAVGGAAERSRDEEKPAPSPPADAKDVEPASPEE